MRVQENISLKKYNTFGFDVKCDHFLEIEKKEELHQLYNILKNKFLILGGGSNILFKQDFSGYVIKLGFKEINIIDENEEFVFVRADAGVWWDDVVKFAIDKGLGGIENLPLIPGTMGAAPIQNIGAYGQELKDSFHSLNGIEISSQKEISLNKEECKFGYRSSIFKNQLKNNFIITDVTLALRKEPVINITYGSISEELALHSKPPYTIKDIYEAVIRIRNSKLPDPKEVGNAGSFFKNPEVSIDVFDKLKLKHPDMPFFLSGNKIKIPAGWLIDQCGWKGYREKDAGCYPKQALILVNYGNARGEEIISLADKIKVSVKEKFNIEIEEEVNII